MVLVAMATLVMCACQTGGPKYRVAEESATTIADADRTPADAFAVADVDANSDRAPRPAPRQTRPQSGEVAASANIELPEAPRPPALTEHPRLVKAARQERAAATAELARRQLPTHLTNQQVQQAAYLSDDCQLPCVGQGCPCCAGPCSSDGAFPGPGDEYLCDGGDHGLPAAVVKTGEVVGLEPEDAVAHYDTVDGRTIITPSNKVCIYAPRFAAVREVVDVRAYARYDAPRGAVLDQPPVVVNDPQKPGATLADLKPRIDRLRQPPSLLKDRDQAGELERDARTAAVVGSLAAYCNLSVVRTGVITGEDRVKIARSSLAAVTWAGHQAPQVVLDNKRAHAEVSVQTPGTIYLLVEPNNPKLRLIKLASECTAHPGEEVEFTLRFDNVGDRVIGNVTIIDHLTTRLEYVPDSQKSSLKAEFKTAPESNDSLTLRWEIDEPLQPGKGGVIQFRTKVR